MQRSTRSWLLYVFVIIILAGAFIYYNSGRTDTTRISNTEFQEILDDGNVTSAVIYQNAQVPTGRVEFATEEGLIHTVFVTDVVKAESSLAEAGITYTVNNVTDSSSTWSIITSILIGIMVIFFLFTMFSRSGAGGAGAGRMADFGKSNAKMSTAGEQKTRFKDVAGLQEEKEELEEIVNFLREPEKYITVGARIPKGVLLVGPPGTGKTLIAKAVAGEAGVPFFSISGSDFVEMFVGVGASRVRDLFASAKKNHPCIVFIDEIDAVARRRGTGMGGSHDEREQTLNQLLVEMDGFGVNEGIIVMAATNRVDILDPAIRRPGRFDRTVTVGRPDVAAREQILNVHAKNKPLSEEVDLKAIAHMTAGFTGADLENLMNEAAIMTASADRRYITQDDIRSAFLKVGVGKEKKSKVISDEEKRITAYHEAGHAILFHVLPHMDPVYTISIIPTGMGAAGYTMPQPENDNMFRTKGMMTEQIIVGLGGRVAEELILDDITTGASQDLKQCTAIARAMVTRFGMSESLGLISYDDDTDDIFIGRDWGHTKNYSEKTAAEIDGEVHRIIDDCHEKAREIITQHRAVLDECARQLIEKERLNRDEFEKIFETVGAAAV